MKSSYFTAGIVIYSRFKCVTIMSFRDRMVSNGGGGVGKKDKLYSENLQRNNFGYMYRYMCMYM